MKNNLEPTENAIKTCIWIERVIKSCKNREHDMVALKLVHQFMLIYPSMAFYFCDELYDLIGANLESRE